MKKKIIWLILLIIGSIVSVNAANYELKELIPVDIETNIITNHFMYRKIKYDDNSKNGDTLHNNAIVFERIKNLTDDERPITISIGLFDKNEKNIGTIHYCSSKDTTPQNLASKEEVAYQIAVKNDYLQKGKTVRDIKYYAVISDNINCHTGGSDEYLGQTIEEIGMFKNTEVNDDAEMFIKIIIVIGALLIILFVYRFVFTTYYDNMDGNDVRQGYKEYNNDLKREREKEARENPPAPKEVVKEKSDEVIAQEQQAKENNPTDLHNMYK